MKRLWKTTSVRAQKYYLYWGPLLSCQSARIARFIYYLPQEISRWSSWYDIDKIPFTTQFSELIKLDHIQYSVCKFDSSRKIYLYTSLYLATCLPSIFIYEIIIYIYIIVGFTVSRRRWSSCYIYLKSNLIAKSKSKSTNTSLILIANSTSSYSK